MDGRLTGVGVHLTGSPAGATAGALLAGDPAGAAAHLAVDHAGLVAPALHGTHTRSLSPFHTQHKPPSTAGMRNPTGMRVLLPVEGTRGRRPKFKIDGTTHRRTQRLHRKPTHRKPMPRCWVFWASSPADHEITLLKFTVHWCTCTSYSLIDRRYLPSPPVSTNTLKLTS
jgi:hypothetical protein